jgi:hypothetical protein
MYLAAKKTSFLSERKMEVEQYVRRVIFECRSMYSDKPHLDIVRSVL